MQIRNRLFLLSGGCFGQLGNVYGVAYENGWLLFDCGSPASYETICRNIDYWNTGSGKVTHVFLTHGHDDHAGTAARFQKEGAEIIIGAEDAEMLERGYFGESSPFQNHVMPSCKADRQMENDGIFWIGDVCIKAYHMPGHTDGSYIYLVEVSNEKYLFTGDMFICDGEKGDIARIWWKGDLSYSSEKLGRSFERLWKMKLMPDVVAGGHMNPRMGDDAGQMIMLAYKEYLLSHR